MGSTLGTPPSPCPPPRSTPQASHPHPGVRRAPGCGQGRSPPPWGGRDRGKWGRFGGVLGVMEPPPPGARCPPYLSRAPPGHGRPSPPPPPHHGAAWRPARSTAPGLVLLTDPPSRPGTPGPSFPQPPSCSPAVPKVLRGWGVPAPGLPSPVLPVSVSPVPSSQTPHARSPRTPPAPNHPGPRTPHTFLEPFHTF